MYTCICAAVTEPEVRACIHAGANTVEEIGDECLAGTGCGTCVHRLDALLRESAPLSGAAQQPPSAA